MSLERLVLGLLQTLVRGLVGEGRLVDPGLELAKSIAASCEMRRRSRRRCSPSWKLWKECVLPLKSNFKAKGKDYLYLISHWDNAVRT